MKQGSLIAVDDVWFRFIGVSWPPKEVTRAGTATPTKLEKTYLRWGVCHQTIDRSRFVHRDGIDRIKTPIGSRIFDAIYGRRPARDLIGQT
jgi:hypothetical protein